MHRINHGNRNTDLSNVMDTTLFLNNLHKCNITEIQITFYGIRKHDYYGLRLSKYTEKKYRADEKHNGI